MKRRNKRLESVKKSLNTQWIMFKRAPLLVLFISSLVGGMTLIVWILGNIIRLILKA